MNVRSEQLAARIIAPLDQATAAALRRLGAAVANGLAEDQPLQQATAPVIGPGKRLDSPALASDRPPIACEVQGISVRAEPHAETTPPAANYPAEAEDETAASAIQRASLPGHRAVLPVTPLAPVLGSFRADVGATRSTASALKLHFPTRGAGRSAAAPRAVEQAQTPDSDASPPSAAIAGAPKPVVGILDDDSPQGTAWHIPRSDTAAPALAELPDFISDAWDNRAAASRQPGLTGRAGRVTDPLMPQVSDAPLAGLDGTASTDAAPPAQVSNTVNLNVSLTDDADALALGDALVQVLRDCARRQGLDI